MAESNRLILRGIGGVALACLTVTAQALGPCSDSKAREWLLRSMGKGRRVTVSAIVVQKGPTGSVQIKFEQARDGFERHTVLQPLSMQGVVVVDDGKRWMMYWPDERRVLSQESPRLRLADAEERVRLADKNYRLKLAETTMIAGRKAVAVVAEPRNSEMAERRYFIDASTSFLLRIEKVGDKKVEALLDTKAVSFPRSIPDCCQMLSPGGARIMERDAPIEIRPGVNSKELVGFEPVLPSDLPLGFVVHQSQIVGSGSRRFVALRITDGLVSATVYEFDGKRESNRRDRSGTLEANGIRFRVEGDLSEDARQKILKRFADDSERAFRLSLEPGRPDTMLKDDMRPG